MLQLYQIRANSNSLPFITFLINSIWLDSFSQKEIRMQDVDCGMKAIGKGTVSHDGHLISLLSHKICPTNAKCLKIHAVLVFAKLNSLV